MQYVIVVNNKNDWPLDCPGAEIVTAKEYIKNPKYGANSPCRVLNFCRSFNYQKLGYYVSLIAAARGHKPQPSLTSIEDFKSPSIFRLVSIELDDLIQKSLKKESAPRFTLNIYFGKNNHAAYDRLSGYVFKQFYTPFLEAKFSKTKGKWFLTSIRPLSVKDIPAEHREFANLQTMKFLNKRLSLPASGQQSRFDLAILVNPDEIKPPSNKKTLQKFVKAAESLGFSAEFIQKSDFSRVGEFDALFIRETTQVNHHTYRFARRAVANGIEVIDDPQSILRCCNKVYLFELLDKHKIPIPKTQIVDKDSCQAIAKSVNYPCVLKKPDSAFSMGVLKVDNEQDFIKLANQLFEDSDIILTQEYLPSNFDWRIGIIDGKPLYACRYFMVKNHWQICRRTKNGKLLEGDSNCVPIDQAPKKVVKQALKAANLIGNGLYGVDIKEINGKCYVIEVNDNPSINVGDEDELLNDQLYIEIMKVLYQRIEKKMERSKIQESHPKKKVRRPKPVLI